MGLINKDPDSAAEVTPEQIALCQKCGFQIAQIVLSDDDDNLLSFAAALAFIPRTGESIKIEDGKLCKVLGVNYKVATINLDGVKIKYLGPNVYAHVIPGTGQTVEV